MSYLRMRLVWLLGLVLIVGCDACARPRDPTPPPPELQTVVEISRFQSCQWLEDRDLSPAQLSKLRADADSLQRLTGIGALEHYFAQAPFEKDMENTLVWVIQHEDKYTAAVQAIGPETAEENLLKGVLVGLDDFVFGRRCGEFD